MSQPVMGAGQRLVTDGGLETDLIFNRGIDLPEFAAYPLLRHDWGRSALRDYFAPYAALAAEVGAGLLVETPTWRANPDWGARLGDDAAALREVNLRAVEFAAALGASEAQDAATVLVSGAIGPRQDGYVPGRPTTSTEAAEYHAPQVRAFAEAGADVVTAYTLIDRAEAIGVVLAARDSGLHVGISFTLETDGRLPDGTAIGDAIAEVDAVAAPDHYLLNCAHPTHVAQAFAGADEPPAWTHRVLGMRCNASRRSHAELDDATDLDDGDPATFATDHDVLGRHLPALAILGGCCGTDVRHVESLWRRVA